LKKKSFKPIFCSKSIVKESSAEMEFLGFCKVLISAFFFANFAKPPLQLHFIISKLRYGYSQKTISAKMTLF
jgi:hypothetical protein